MFKDITPPRQQEVLVERTNTRLKIEAEEFTRRVINEDDRTRERSRRSSFKAQKAMEKIDETLQ